MTTGAKRSRRVAVIGAGAAGLVAARELRSEGHVVTVLEQSGGVGGVWRFDARTEADALGLDEHRPHKARVHSSMYKHLRTNLPREIMSYSDFPFDSAVLGPRYSGDRRRFCSHQEVLGYLEAFADFYQLKPLVRYHTRVLAVEPVAAAEPASAAGSSGATTGSEADANKKEEEEEEVVWSVTSERLASNGRASTSSAGGSADGDIGRDSGSLAQEREMYDAVVVCNGHYAEPRLPDPDQVRGLLPPGHFPGQQLHSHNYREPAQWAGKTVLVVGASNSGEDVSRELSAGGAARVLLAARSWKNEAWGADAAPYGPANNIYRYPMVSELHADGSVTFEGGRREGPIDAIIWCTGYKYSFPFLRGAAADVAAVSDNCVGSPLWLHMMPPGPLAPGLSFIGLPWKIVPFPQMELQSKLIARLLSGRVPLPAENAMRADVAAHLQAMREQGLPTRYMHMQGMDQFAYNDMLAAMCGPDVPPLPAWREVLYRATSALKRSRPEDYRDGDIAEAGGPEAARAVQESEADIRGQAERLGLSLGAAKGLAGSEAGSVSDWVERQRAPAVAAAAAAR
ncbi:hypothetical protein HYH02_009444 [Chlamydomonas schloesseri]|uniref:Flavin-containing monooxygenase n=1 Tax=Chlamydomonas schloesseri TaxID=2026947 RepID=A0A835TLW5_9CHLO|nr:hypothetical protein HYH02_009444 [Chlamydomonas schloesseri]|eukprot:KAG2443029.1 hypothetical protein HYH02_009444 [Chlamydomonas schloesseri]